MKRATFYLKIVVLACATVWVSTSCGEKEEESAPELTYLIDGSSPATLSVLSGEVTKTVSVTSNGAWNITVSAGSPAWIQASPDRGDRSGSFTLTVQANTSAESRAGTLTFVMEKKTVATLTVAQSGFGAELEAIPATPEQAAATGGSLEFAVAANTDWTYSLSAGADAWLREASKTAGALTLTVDPNTATEERNATVTFSLTGYPAVTQTVNISQAGITVEEAMDEEDFGAGVTPVVYNISAADLKTTLEQIVTEGNYVVNMTGDALLTDAAVNGINITLATPGVTISLRGSGNTISPANDASIVRISEGELILRDVTLSKTGSQMPTVFVGTNGQLVIHEGVSITNSSSGSPTNTGVDVSGQFLMKGGEIHGHRRMGGAGGGVYLHGAGNFRMEGGKIYDNTAGSGGGVFISNGSFIMNGGEFYDNHSTNPDEGGGAVYLWAANNHFEIRPGAVIYGNDGGDGKTGNTATNGDTYGHALTAFYSGGAACKYRSRTVRNETLSVTVNSDATGTSELTGDWNAYP